MALFFLPEIRAPQYRLQVRIFVPTYSYLVRLLIRCPPLLRLVLRPGTAGKPKIIATVLTTNTKRHFSVPSCLTHQTRPDK